MMSSSHEVSIRDRNEGSQVIAHEMKQIPSQVILGQVLSISMLMLVVSFNVGKILRWMSECSWHSSRYNIILVPFFWILAGAILCNVFMKKMIEWNAVVVLRTTPSVAKNISRTLMSSSLDEPQKITSRKRKRSLRAQLIATGADLIPASAQEPEHVGIPFHRHDSATQFATIEKKLPYSFDQIVEAIFKKFKEPLPDPAQPQVESIAIEFERRFQKWNCVVQKRVLKIRHGAPYFIRRFINQDHIYFVELLVVDHRHEKLYTCSYNQSPASLGVIKIISTYEPDEESKAQTKVRQTGEVQLGSSLGMARSMIQNYIQKNFESVTEKDRRHLQIRLEELNP